MSIQRFFFPEWISLGLSFLLWPVFQIFFAELCQRLPSSWFNSQKGYFQTYPFEQDGKLYQKLFAIKKWKKYLPDGAAVKKSGYRKKHMKDFSNQNLAKFLEESCRAELGHLLPITSFWIFGLFLPPIGICFMLLYALAVNLPCILAQRYNRPRLLQMMKKREDDET